LEDSIGKRLENLVLKLGITKTAFAEGIKVSQPYISKLIAGKGEPSERLIDDIVEKYSVNKDWLLTGAGGEKNMLIPEDMRYMQTVEKLGQEKNEFKKFYLNMMMGLPDEYWDYIYKEFKKFDKEIKSNEIHDAKANHNPLFDGIPDTPEELEKMYPVIDMKDKKKIR
jgi:transcriptional regulator with XRE-family HTH domain